jgi:nitrogen-specific signal transduction histidine kinase/CheY-like chemotaxis protein
MEIVMHITAIRDERDAIVAICSTATDMTPWTKLQAQFFQAQRVESAGKLAAGIAHDFNNLVTVIAANCDLLLMDLPEFSPQRGEIEEIQRAAGRATNLARRMLGAVRNSEIVAAPVDVRETVREAMNLVTRGMTGGVAINVHADQGELVVLADPTQIEQVLLNLVLNAADAMPNGGTVDVRAGSVMLPRPLMTRVGEIAAGRYVELVVSDNGPGMSEETFARLFEPFFTTKPRGKGTGLGLATVIGIVRVLHGGVTVTTEIGAGTTFRVLLPLAQSDASARRRTPLSIPVVPERDQYTLLLVQTEDAVRTNLSRTLEREGYHVLEARHGGEALRMIAENDGIDLLLADLIMPGLGGAELSERATAQGRRIPTLFITEETSDGDSADSAPQGVQGRTIQSPFEIETLLAELADLSSADRKKGR